MAVVKNLMVRAGADFSELQKEMVKAGKMMKNTGQELRNIGQGLTLGITMPILGIGAAGIKAASDLKEVQNVVDTSFGKSAEAVNAWSKTTLSKFGLTELQAKQFSGSMRAMLGSMGLANGEADKMSMSLSELAGDMASFYNISQDEAWTKIRSGISGETEPLKQLGINMSVANLEAYALSKGINTAWKEMTAAQQATLRYNYLMDTSKNAQGDFAKTSGSFANQLRIIKGMFSDISAQLMSNFLPYLEKALSVVKNGMEWFRGLSQSQKDLIVKIALVVAAIGPLIYILGTLVSTVGSVMTWGAGISKALMAVQAGTKGIGAIFSAVFGPAGVVLLVIAAIAALVAGLVWLWKNNDDFKNGVINIWNTIVNFLNPIIDNIKTSLVQAWSYISSTLTPIMASLKDLFASTWQAIYAVLSFVWEGIKQDAMFIFDALKLYWSIYGESIINTFKIVWNAVAAVFNGAVNVLSGIMKVITGIFTGDWSKALEGLKQIATGIWGAVVGVFKGGVNLIIESINFMIGALNKIKIPKMHIPLVGDVGPVGFNIPKIPMLAKGGITNGPTMALIGDNPGGQEVVSPLDKLTGIVTTAVVQAMQFTQGSNNNTSSGDIVLNIDGRTFARIIQPYQQKENNRSGMNVRVQPI